MSEYLKDSNVSMLIVTMKYTAKGGARITLFDTFFSGSEFSVCLAKYYKIDETKEPLYLRGDSLQSRNLREMGRINHLLQPFHFLLLVETWHLNHYDRGQS